MEPTAGIEPATRSLQNYCSATELSWHLNLLINYRPIGSASYISPTDQSIDFLSTLPFFYFTQGGSTDGVSNLMFLIYQIFTNCQTKNHHFFGGG